MADNAHTEQTDSRYELKLTAGRHELARVRAWLRTHPAAFSSLYPARRVNSVYFDTPQLGSFHDNLAGVSDRCKLRLRWYGDDLTEATGTLELKIKQGLLGRKMQYALPGRLRLDRVTWRDLLAGMRRGLPPLWRNCLGMACCPTVLTRYRRAYYVSADIAVRVTVDWDLHVYDQRRSMHPNLRWSSPLADRVIIELKCANRNRGKLADVAAKFPIRVERCSKYISGLQAGLAN